MPDTGPNVSKKADRYRLPDSDYVGEGWTPVQPGTDPVLYGHVEFGPKGRFEVRSYQTFTLTYTVGRFGLDDTGAIRVVFRAFLMFEHCILFFFMRSFTINGGIIDVNSWM